MLLGGIRLCRFLLKMLENLLNDLRILNTGNDFDLTATVLTNFDVDIEDSFESLHPGHGSVSLLGALVEPVGFRWFRIGFLTAFCRCHLNAVFAVRRVYTVESSEVDPRFGHQRCQLGY